VVVSLCACTRGAVAVAGRMELTGRVHGAMARVRGGKRFSADCPGPLRRGRAGAGARGRELGLVGRMAEGEGWLGCFSFFFFILNF
jgi:hypothetical protein